MAIRARILYALCRYRKVRHPRWGTIVAIFSTRKIMEGEELLCNYGYG